MVTEALRLHKINAYYGDSHVLRDVSFSVADRRVLALLGRNGVGKTTCINTVIGFLRARSGDIHLFGTQIARADPETIVAHGIGLVPQGRRIFPTLTVRENLLVAARPPHAQATRTKTWNLERVFELFPRLRERQQNLGANLSGGEQQMLAIGRALMTNPRVLLLDEPSEGLAPQAVHELAATLVRLKQEALTVVLVEQNAALALEIADDVVILAMGVVAHAGPVQDIRDNADLLNRHLGVC